MRLFTAHAYDSDNNPVGVPVSLAAKSGPDALRQARKHFASRLTSPFVCEVRQV